MKGKKDLGSVAIGTWPTPERPVQISISAKVAFDLKAFQKVQASVLDRLGCPACCSGMDIRWDIARNFAVDERGAIHNVAAGVVVVDG